MAKVYDASGNPHELNVRFDRFMLMYAVVVDGEIWSRADSRTEADADMDDYIRYKRWSIDKPKKARGAKSQKKTPLVPASK